MKNIVFFCLLLSTFASKAQRASDLKIDSLQNELKQEIADTTRIHSLARLGQAYEGIDSIQSFKNAFEALKLAESINYERGIAHAKMAIGNAYMDYYDLDKAMQYLKEAIEVGERVWHENPSVENTKLLATSKYNLAVNYMNTNRHEEETKLVEEVIPMVQQLKDTAFLANIHNNLGITYMNLAQYPQALSNLIKSENLFSKTTDTKKAIFNKLIFVNLYYNMDSIEAIPQKLKQAKTLLEITPESTDWHLYHTQKGLYHLKKKEYNNAIAEYGQSMQLLKENKLHVNVAPLLQNYAKAYELSGRYKKAIEYINRYIEDAESNSKLLNTFQGYYKRSQYEAASNNYENAYNDLLFAIDVYDSIEVQKSVRQLNEFELKYETAKKEKEILSLQKENSEKALALEKRKSQTYLYGIIIAVLAFVLFLGYLGYRSKLKQQRRKERKYEQEMVALKHKQEADIYSAMIEGQEKERKRLAIDLHDGLGGRLSGISLNLSKLDKDEPNNYPKKALQKVIKDLDTSLSELRSIARNMMPETLMKFGLEAALKDYCSSMNNAQTTTTLQFYGEENDIEIGQKVTIYRVIQELINNAIKHAKASEILVQFIRENDQIDITVEDNGVGMSEEVIEIGTDGMGLTNLRTRVAYLKGNLEFHSELNEGTTVNVNLNINAA